MARIAVLASGGLDSAVLLADLARENEVFPVYVEFGLAWEQAEKQALQAYLAALENRNFQPLTVLEAPARSLYGRHWSLTGEDVPEYDAAWDSDYLPGRNVLLIGVTAVWSALHGIHQIAIGSLLHNPYPDATPEFFADYSRLLSGALAHEIKVLAPYRGRAKSELIRASLHLPLKLTLTCVDPKEGPTHCGACVKCRERHEAFVAAGVEDTTRYAIAVR